jgi:hypothetical protein
MMMMTDDLDAQILDMRVMGVPSAKSACGSAPRSPKSMPFSMRTPA